MNLLRLTSLNAFAASSVEHYGLTPGASTG